MRTIAPSTLRLLLALFLVVAVAVGYTTAMRPRQTLPEPSAPLHLVAAGTPMPSVPPTTPPFPSTPPPSPAPTPERTYVTSSGLRYADRDAYQARLAGTGTVAAAAAAIQSFLSQYGIALWAVSGGFDPATDPQEKWTHLGGSATDLADAKAYGSWLIDEWSKYPREWIEASGIPTVVFARNLHSGGEFEGGLVNSTGTVFYDVGLVDTLTGTGAEDYFRGLIQHEFAHAVEVALHSSLRRPDPAWSSNNPPGFAYGQLTGITAHPAASFVTRYAETDIGEDKAETYAYMFVDGRSKDLGRWEKSDPGLAGKVAYYRGLIKSKVPAMDDAYFAAINP